MAISKKHDEFHAVDLGTGWEVPAGYPTGIQQKILSGDLTVGNDAKGNGGTSFKPNTYACRPPGAVHGPFKSEKGCMLLEVHYYDPA